MLLCFTDCRVSQNSDTFGISDLLFCAFSEDLENYFNGDYGIAHLRNRVKVITNQVEPMLGAVYKGCYRIQVQYFHLKPTFLSCHR